MDGTKVAVRGDGVITDGQGQKPEVQKEISELRGKLPQKPLSEKKGTANLFRLSELVLTSADSRDDGFQLIPLSL